VRNPSSNTRFARVTAVAVSVAATLAAGSALATTPPQKYYGGGSTFAAPPYIGSDYLDVSPEARLSTNAGNTAGLGFTTSGITAGSAFDTYKNVTSLHNLTSYCQTGSGFGKNSLNGSASAPANGSCNDYSTTPAGLSAPTASPDFIGTDAPYSTTDYNAFLSGPQITKQGIIQAPTLAGAVALAHGDSIDNVKLSNAQVCKIYSGKITSWSSITGVTGTGNKGPITIVYRTDGSGTTFSFTRYLAATCNGTANVPTGFVFTPNQSFASAIPGGVATVYGSRAVGESGNPGVVGAVLDGTNNPNALGYADVGEVINEGAKYALVNGWDPTKFGTDPGTGNPKALNLAATTLLTGKVLDGSTANAVPGSASDSIKNCVLLVDPALKLTNSYPIVAFTYLASYYSGNGNANHVNGLRALYNLFYTTTTRPVLGQGFAYLGSGSTAFGTTVENTVKACIN
jgi:ABC-type phosphate transport system substrate-binding protein